jgi:hypothetical protein
MKAVLLLGMGPAALTALESLVQRFTVVGLVREMRGSQEDQQVASRAAEWSVPCSAMSGPAPWTLSSPGRVPTAP